MAALANLLLLNRTERALADYQRDLRALPVALTVSNVPTADAAIANIAGVSATGVLRAGSRLERSEGIEKLISEQRSTDLAALIKVSGKLSPVPMRE